MDYVPCMIARVAHFAAEPDRFSTRHKYAYVLDAIASVDGFVAGYHLTGPDGSLSISIWQDEAAMRSGEAAVGRERERLQVAGSPPDRVDTYRVENSRLP